MKSSIIYGIFLFGLMSLCILFSSKAYAYTPPVPEKYTWHNKWTLYPADADLRFARDMYINRKSEPNTLSSWENGAVVMFPIHISEAGNFEISIEYNRHATMKQDLSLAIIITENPTLYSISENTGIISTTIETTEGLENFTYKKIGTLSLPKGSMFLMVTNKESSPHEYIMNLSKIYLERK